MRSADEERILDSLQLRYQRVQDSLEDEIRRGGRPPGSRLPPERALAEHFGVSRVTLRRALSELERRGVVEHAQSRGWMVAGTRVGEPPNVLMSFSEMAASRNLGSSSRVIHQQARPATLDEADTFGLAPGAALFDLERLRLMDDVPILIDRTKIPLAFAPGLDEVDFSIRSLYRTLERRFGLRPTRARFSVDAVGANEEQASYLDLQLGEPLLRCLQLTEDQNGRLFEFCEMTYRGDRYRFRTELVRSPETASDDGHAPRFG
jgi:GntR family transcriptional regulator